MSPALRRRLLLLTVVLAVAVAAPAGAAHAKGLTGLTVCGARGCVDRTAALRGSPALAEDLLFGGITVADPGPAPFVRLKEHMGEGGQEFGASTVVYFPASATQRFEDGTFHRADPRLHRALRRLVRGVAPLPASALTPIALPPAPPPVPAAAPARPRAPAAAADGPAAAWLLAPAVAAAAAAALSLLALRRRRRAGPSGRPATG